MEKEDIESEEEEELDPHCHESCKNYKKACVNPKKCETRRRYGKDCPIKEALGDHLCGFMGTMKERELNRINSGRTEEQRLSVVGYLNDGYIKAIETRYAAIAFCSLALYSEVTDETPLEGWTESIYDNNGSVKQESEHEWDIVCSDMDGCMFDDEYSRSHNIDQEVCEEFKSFEELSPKEIDEVAAKIRKIRPKFEDLNRPDIIGTMKWLEYENMRWRG